MLSHECYCDNAGNILGSIHTLVLRDAYPGICNYFQKDGKMGMEENKRKKLTVVDRMYTGKRNMGCQMQLVLLCSSSVYALSIQKQKAENNWGGGLIDPPPKKNPPWVGT